MPEEAHPSESEEWLVARIGSWVETYKKAMLTPVALTLIARYQPVGVATIAQRVVETTGWHITERGLYRTLKRLQDSGLLSNADADAPRTGAKRKELSLTPLGDAFLLEITNSLVVLPAPADRNQGE